MVVRHTDNVWSPYRQAKPTTFSNGKAKPTNFSNAVRHTDNVWSPYRQAKPTTFSNGQAKPTNFSHTDNVCSPYRQPPYRQRLYAVPTSHTDDRHADNRHTDNVCTPYRRPPYRQAIPTTAMPTSNTNNVCTPCRQAIPTKTSAKPSTQTATRSDSHAFNRQILDTSWQWQSRCSCCQCLIIIVNIILIVVNKVVITNFNQHLATIIGNCQLSIMKPPPVPSTPSKKRKIPEPEFTSPPKKGLETPGRTPKTPSKLQQTPGPTPKTPSKLQQPVSSNGSSMSQHVYETPRKRTKRGQGTSRTPAQKEQRRLQVQAKTKQLKEQGLTTKRKPRTAEQRERETLLRREQRSLRSLRKKALAQKAVVLVENREDEDPVQNLELRDPDNNQGQKQPKEEPLPQRDLSSPDPNKKPHELPSLPAVRELGLQSEDPTSKGFPPPNVSNICILPPRGPHNPTQRELELERIAHQLTSEIQHLRTLLHQQHQYHLQLAKDKVKMSDNELKKDALKAFLTTQAKNAEGRKEAWASNKAGFESNKAVGESIGKSNGKIGDSNAKITMDQTAETAGMHDFFFKVSGLEQTTSKPPNMVPGGAATAATGTSSLSGGSFQSNGGFGAAAASLGGGGAAFVGTGNQGSPMMQSNVEWYSFREDNLFHPPFQCVMDNTLPENPYNNKYYIKIVDGQPGAGWEGAVGALYNTLNGADEARLKMFQQKQK